jgi:hypothetical protein
MYIVNFSVYFINAINVYDAALTATVKFAATLTVNDEHSL